MKKIILLIILLIISCKKEEFSRLKWKVGQWVYYKINDTPVAISIVGREGKDFWVETVEPGIVVKVLVSEEDFYTPKRLIVKEVGKSPVEVSLDKFSITTHFPDIKITQKDKIKSERIVLRNGKLYTFYCKRENGDFWLSNSVPIFGLVKYKSDKKTIVLYDYGLSGAKSEIKG